MQGAGETVMDRKESAYERQRCEMTLIGQTVQPFDFDFEHFSCIFSRPNNEAPLLQTELDLMNVRRLSYVSRPAEEKSFNWPKALSKLAKFPRCKCRRGRCEDQRPDNSAL